MERKTVVGTGGELLVHQLLAQGVDYVFTNTGSAEAGFFNGLSRFLVCSPSYPDGTTGPVSSRWLRQDRR